MRILVTGSRDWPEWNVVNKALLDACGQHGDLTIVHGACPTGADQMADKFCKYQGLTPERHPADWSTGPSAGPNRNKAMVALGADLCLAFITPCNSPRCRRPQPHGSHGATGTADLAEAAGIEVIRYYPTRWREVNQGG
jgi:hypothetical protein